MKYFIVELTNGQTYFDGESNKMRLNMNEYSDFMAQAKELGILDVLLKKISYGCAKCKAFAIPIAPFYEAVADKIYLHGINEIINGLVERVYLTEAEWIRFTTYGQKSVDSIKDANIFEANGEMFRYVADEVFFKFDDNCECNETVDQSLEK
ncbi:MAG: hypothetical protein ABSA46_11640 [Thermodesulfovibrionales bacterium]|jgi:hypothetical protein